jgi:nitrogenase molybdenum-iron protein beta chain
MGLIGHPHYGCALSAQQTVLAIPRGIPIVHAGPGCSSKAFGFSAYGAGYQGEGYAGGSAVSSTNATEQDVVFGGERKLRDLVDGTLRIIDGDLYVILSGCTSGIIGDDVVKIANEFADQGAPVVGAETAGFRGSSYQGHEIVVSQIIDQFVGDRTPQKRPRLVNVFGIVPFQDPFWRGDLENLKRLLESIGLEVNVLFGHGSKGAEEWLDIPNAQFNLVVSPWVDLGVAEDLQRRYGTPFLHCPLFPVGAAATSRFLRQVGLFAGIPAAVVESVIEREESRYYDYFLSLCNFISDMNNNIPQDLYTVADSLYGLGMSEFLVNELGCTLRGLYLVDDPPKKRVPLLRETATALGAAFDQALTIENDGYVVQQAVQDSMEGRGGGIILGSTAESHIAESTQSILVRTCLPINDDVIVTRSYLGYDGGLRLVEDIYAGVFRTGVISTLTQTRAL